MIMTILMSAQCSSKNSDELVNEGIELSKKGYYDEALDAFLKAV